MKVFFFFFLITFLTVTEVKTNKGSISYQKLITAEKNVYKYLLSVVHVVFVVGS